MVEGLNVLSLRENDQALSAARAYVNQLLQPVRVEGKLIYHVNKDGIAKPELDHTTQVETEAIRLMQFLPDNDISVTLGNGQQFRLTKPGIEELIRLAAIFHDVGYSQKYSQNEPIGASVAEEWMRQRGSQEYQIVTVKEAILITTVGNTNYSNGEIRNEIAARNPIATIVGAADVLSVIANTNLAACFEGNELYRQECLVHPEVSPFMRNLAQSPSEWVDKQTDFLNAQVQTYSNWFRSNTAFTQSIQQINGKLDGIRTSGILAEANKPLWLNAISK